MKKVKIPDKVELPLIGCVAFGLIDRGTNLVQVRPISGCCLNCIFCSVDEGPFSKTRITSYEIALDYLIEWFKVLIKFKRCKQIEAHLDCSGEVTLYPKLIDLVQALKEIEEVKVISMQTKAFLLNEKEIKELEEAGLSRINLSIDALDETLAKKLAGTETYDLKKILEKAEFVTQNTSIDLLIAPVWIPGYNDQEIPKIIEFALGIKAGKRWPALGIQKYLPYKLGRKPKRCKPMSWKEFYSKLKEYEKIYKTKLILRPKDFGIFKTKILPLVFKKNEVLKVKIVADGWIKSEKLAHDKNFLRTISVVGAKSYGWKKVRIVSNKHNIYVAKVV